MTRDFEIRARPRSAVTRYPEISDPPITWEKQENPERDRRLQYHARRAYELFLGLSVTVTVKLFAHDVLYGCTRR